MNKRSLIYCLLSLHIYSSQALAQDSEIISPDEFTLIEDVEQKTISKSPLISSILNRLDGVVQSDRHLATIELKNSATKKDTPQLIESLKKGGHVDKQIAIVQTITKLKDIDALPALRYEYENGQIESKREVITAFGIIGSDYANPLLTDAVKNSTDTNIQLRSAASLGLIGTPSALYSLKSASSSLTEGPLRAAQFAIEWIQKTINPDISDLNLPAGRKILQTYKGVKFNFYHPDYRRRDDNRPWLLVCVHGNKLDSDKIFNECFELAQKYQLAVLAPLFDPINFPDYQNLDHRSTRSDLFLLELVKACSTQVNLVPKEFYLYGKDEGADFVTRFSLAHNDNIARALSENSQDMIKLDESAAFPVGMGFTPLTPDIKLVPANFLKTDLIFTGKGSQIDRFETRLNELSMKFGVRSRIKNSANYRSSKATELLLEEFIHSSRVK